LDLLPVSTWVSLAEDAQVLVAVLPQRKRQVDSYYRSYRLIFSGPQLARNCMRKGAAVAVLVQQDIDAAGIGSMGRNAGDDVDNSNQQLVVAGDELDSRGGDQGSWI